MKNLKSYSSAEEAQENLLNLLEYEEAVDREVRYHILAAMVSIERALIIADRQAEQDKRIEDEAPMERPRK